MLHVVFWVTSKFEVDANIIVITKAANSFFHGNLYSPQEHRRRTENDRATVEQISKIIRFLWNIED